MLKTRPGRFQPRRRGVILIVVLAMLTLFALVGISFVLVANSQETSSRIASEAETQFRPEIDGQAAFSLFLGQLLYDCSDDPNGARSALRGQSLGRNIFGWWDGNNPTGFDVETVNNGVLVGGRTTFSCTYSSPGG